MNNSKDEFYHIGRASQMLSELYDLDLPIRKVREGATRVLNNAKPIKAMRFLLRCEIKDFKITLPCNNPVIESVTGRAVLDESLFSHAGTFTLFEKMNFKDGRIETVVGEAGNPDAITTLPDLGVVDQVDEEVLLLIPSGVQFNGVPHAFFENFNLDGNVLSFNKTDSWVDIIFHTVLEDEFGFPFFTEKGIWATVHYLVYLEMTKRFYKREVGENVARFAKEDYERSVAQARTPDSMTDNQADKIMSVLTSKYRHKFGNPFKSQ